MLEYDVLGDSRLCYIIFDKRQGEKRFWNILTSKGFDHVFLLTETINGTTLALLPTPSGCLLDEWDYPIEEAITFFQHCTAIVRYQIPARRTDIWMPRGIITCVSLIKSILGIGGWSVTPRGLYKQLTKE
jgi:hypothetical protein